jgi:hypothetical protein
MSEYPPVPELDYSPEAISAVSRELESIATNRKNQVLIRVADLERMDPRTRLILLLKATSGQCWILDPAVYLSIKREFYYCVNPHRGGLTRAAYEKYARRCPLLVGNAEYHRMNFQKSRNADPA